MRIKRLAVKGLFGVFDHEIPLNMDERITIIHGPNGFGKTAILRFLNNFFNSRYSDLKSTSFDSFSIEFDNESKLEITKRLQDSEETNINFKLYSIGDEEKNFSLNQLQDENNNSSFHIRILDDLVPGLERVGPEQWAYLPTEELLTFREVVERFADFLPKGMKGSYVGEPDWLKELKDSIHIRLIESQRLFDIVSPNPRLRRNIHRPSMSPTVSTYSNELAELMQEKFKEYGTTSQSLDKTFPLRIMKQETSADVTEEQLRNQLSEIEITRSGLIEVGLLDKDETSDVQIQPQDMDKSTRNALSVYVGDVERKLNVFSETAKKIELLRRIINKKFSYSRKEMNFSKEKGFIFETHYSSDDINSHRLSPNDLSSGEQHELVLLYELLFKVVPNSLVLIDEPELSLHVTWQRQFLKDLQEIMKLTDLSVMMATHSPDIIQDRWDLTVSLAEDKE